MIATADNYVKSANFKVLKILKFHIRKVNMSTFRLSVNTVPDVYVQGIL